MVAVLRPDLQFVPMQHEHLNDVIEIERVAYPFPWTLGNFADSLEAGYSAWLMLDRAMLLGYGVFMLAFDDAHLLNLTIAPNVQARGYGARLLERLMLFAHDHGARRIFLEVRPSNVPARRLYESAGFELVGVRRGYYPNFAGAREDALVMERKL